MECNANMILPNLWLGNYKSSIDKIFLSKNKIKTIIRITDIKYPKFENFNYLTIPIKDSDLCYLDINYSNKLFDYVGNIIKDSLIKGESVLIHCKRGHHRSAGFICAFMMKYLNIDYKICRIYINNIRNKALAKKKCIDNLLVHYQKYIST